MPVLSTLVISSGLLASALATELKQFSTGVAPEPTQEFLDSLPTAEEDRRRMGRMSLEHGAEWMEHRKMFGNNDCKLISSIENMVESDCRMMCVVRKPCNAINFARRERKCELRFCSDSAKQPGRLHSKFRGQQMLLTEDPAEEAFPTAAPTTIPSVMPTPMPIAQRRPTPQTGAFQVGKLQRGAVFDDFVVMDESYSLRFTIKPHGTVDELSNIIHLTADNKDQAGIGSRAPAVFFKPGTTELKACTGCGGSEFCIESDFPLVLHKETEVAVVVQGRDFIIYQHNDSGSRFYRAASEQCNDPWDPRGAVGTLYVSNPWYPAANAEVRAVKYSA